MRLKSKVNKRPNRDSYRQKTGSNSDLWLECARRGLSADPLIHSALQQLSVSYDFNCEQLVQNSIRSFDIREILNPDPFRDTNPSNSAQVCGPIDMGQINHTGVAWGIKPASLTEHVCLIGRTGGGKTTAIKRILSHLLKRGNQ
jgi:hypothetical protein